MKTLTSAVVALALMTAPLYAGNVEPFVVVEEEVVEPAGSNAGWLILGLAVIAIGAAVALSGDDDDDDDDEEIIIVDTAN